MATMTTAPMSTTQTPGKIGYKGDSYYKYPLLKRMQENILLEQYGQPYIVPANSTDVAKFRRYEALSGEPKELQEGVTPAGTTMTYTDYKVSLKQYGDFIEMSDKLIETNEDRIMSEAADVLGEQAAEMMELVRFGVLCGGTNVHYVGGGAARNTVTAVWSVSDQRRVVSSLRRQRTKQLTRKVKSNADWGTEPIAASYIAIAHTDLESTIRNMDGFVPAEKYGSETPSPNEIGKVEAVRYLLTTLAPKYDGEGASATGGVQATGGKADVYPILILGKDAYGLVNFKGSNSIEMIVHTPRADSVDKLAQRGHVGWKGYHAACILNDLWLARVETAILE